MYLPILFVCLWNKKWFTSNAHTNKNPINPNFALSVIFDAVLFGVRFDSIFALFVKLIQRWNSIIIQVTIDANGTLQIKR